MLFFYSGETMKFRLMSAVLASVLATGVMAQTAPVASGPVDKAALAYALI